MRTLAMCKGRRIHKVDGQIMIKYHVSSTLSVPCIFLVAILNYSQELHIFPHHENCLRSDIIVNPLKFFFAFIFPLAIIFLVNLFFDSNQWQRPRRNHVNMKDIYSVIFNQIQIKSSALTFLLLLVIMPRFLKSFDCLEFSTMKVGLLIASYLLVIFIAKGPCMLSWTAFTYKKNLQEAQNSLREAEVELQQL